MSETADIPVEVTWTPRMKLKVTYERETFEQHPDGTVTEERRVDTDVGVITAVPSRKFDRPSDEVAFDYELRIDGRKGAVRSVDFQSGRVKQLMYDAGGDRDWESFGLKKIEVVGFEFE